MSRARGADTSAHNIPDTTTNDIRDEIEKIVSVWNGDPVLPPTQIDAILTLFNQRIMSCVPERRLESSDQMEFNYNMGYNNAIKDFNMNLKEQGL